MRFAMRWLALGAAMAMAQGQIPDAVRKAEITGGGGTSGKCTIEVRVDMSAEVDIYGDSGRLRTLAGQPATWNRLQCTEALPYNMSDFRFRGIDGRGNVKLLSDPRNNNSMAVIRIDDPRSGAEGYTFEIEWSGASGGAPTGGFATGWGTPAATTGAATTGTGAYGGRRQGNWGNRMSAEQAMDLCRTELRTRAERDYGLRNITVTSTAADTNQGRRDWVTGTFTDRAGYRRGGTYKFNCQVNYTAGQVGTLEILRPDGTMLQPGTTSTTTGTTGWGTTTPQSTTSYDQNRVLRACQDAAAARAKQDGYQNLTFQTTVVDTSRANYVSGSMTGSRGPLTDSFTFGCSMDFPSAQVRSVDLTRR